VLLTVPKPKPLFLSFFLFASQHIMESRPSRPGHANIFTYSADFTTHALKRTFTALQEEEYLPVAQSRRASSHNTSMNQPMKHKMTNDNAVECLTLPAGGKPLPFGSAPHDHQRELISAGRISPTVRSPNKPHAYGRNKWRPSEPQLS
jgi:hypothetical protein